MPQLEFTIECDVDQDKLVEMMTDYENIGKFFPPQLKTRIIETDDVKAITEEVLSVSVLKQQIIQQSIHRKVQPDVLETEIISGPAKGTTARITFEKMESGTKIVINANIKLGLKYLLLSSFIKKKYKIILNSLFKKIIGIAQLTEGKTWRESIIENGNCLVLSEKKFPPLKFYGWWYSELQNMFVGELYGSLPVKDKIVVDVGSNICDSTIYFITKGAQKVIALEPFPLNYQMGKKNIEINHLDEKIVLIWAGISKTSGEIQIDDSLEKGYTSFRLAETTGNTSVKTMTLNDVVKQHNVIEGVLKLDCEGCEYDTILASTTDTLSKFSYILIEYHNGYRDLKKKLESSGFVVTLDVKESNDVTGYLHAQNTS